MVTEGRVLVEEGGEKYELGPGEVFYTPMGTGHREFETLEDLTLVWVERPLKGKKRTGHLHRE